MPMATWQITSLAPFRRTESQISFTSREEFSPAINLLEGKHKHLAVSQFLSIFHHLWPEFWGPRMEYLLRNTLLLLAETFPNASLADIPKVLADLLFREQLVNLLPSGELRNFWLLEFAQYSKTFRNEAIAPILNKIGAVTLNPLLRPMLCRRANDLNFQELMGQGKIIIANLAKGSVGEDASSLLGSILLSKLALAGLARASVAEEDRPFFAIYADEAQQFLTESSLSLFSELRKYGVSSTWATQYLASLPETIRNAILGNVGTLIAFTLSGEDARILSQEMGPPIRVQDLVDLPAHHLYLKLKIDGVTSRTFSAQTIEPSTSPNSNLEVKRHLRNFSRKSVVDETAYINSARHTQQSPPDTLF